MRHQNGPIDVTEGLLKGDGKGGAVAAAGNGSLGPDEGAGGLYLHDGQGYIRYWNNELGADVNTSHIEISGGKVIDALRGGGIWLGGGQRGDALLREIHFKQNGVVIGGFNKDGKFFLNTPSTPIASFFRTTFNWQPPSTPSLSVQTIDVPLAGVVATSHLSISPTSYFGVVTVEYLSAGNVRVYYRNTDAITNVPSFSQTFSVTAMNF